MSKEIAPASEPAKERQTSRKRLRQAKPKPDSAAVPIEYAFEDEFDEQAYLRQHPEVAAAISEGICRMPCFTFGYSTRSRGRPPRRHSERCRRGRMAPQPHSRKRFARKRQTNRWGKSPRNRVSPSACRQRISALAASTPS